MEPEQSFKQAIERFDASQMALFRRMNPQALLPPDLPLTGPQLMLLHFIAKEGECQVTKLASIMEVKPSAITVMIDRLVGHGFVNRKASLEDRRVVLLKVTEQGQSVLQQVRGIRDRKLQQLFAQLQPEELDAFLTTFEKIISQM
ncbi:MarR family transcriptional regulator [Paenibacillus sp. y28]|uniref:MarR family transcriptional regulator n=1 Tax=Paenibacillus sp. y28 TaxID=3129110 RepID=UPI003018E72C